MKVTQFQLAVLLLFGMSAVGGLIAFATFQSTGDKNQAPIDVVMWGVIPASMMDTPLKALSERSQRKVTIRYAEKSLQTFERDLVEAIADGKSPDLIFIPDSLTIAVARRILPIPTTMLTQRQFLDTYAQATETFLGPFGAFGIPVAIDPFFLFWNRDHLQGAGIAQPPTQWSALPGLAERLTVRNRAFEIERSTVAMGEYANIENAKDIILTLLIQSGIAPVVYKESGLDSNLGAENIQIVANALTYYTQFSNPTFPVYSWNRSLPEAREAFIADRLTFYTGFASEARIIRDRNPNLNFDIAPIPQPVSAPLKTTLARTYGVSVVRTSPKAYDALAVVIELFTTTSANSFFSSMLGVAPARRDSLAVQQVGGYSAALYESAIMGRSWIDPDPGVSQGIFERMISSMISGERNARDSVSRADGELKQVVPKSIY